MYFDLGNNYLELQNLKEAKHIFQKSLKFNPENKVALNNLTFVYHQLGQPMRPDEILRELTL